MEVLCSPSKLRGRTYFLDRAIYDIQVLFRSASIPLPIFTFPTSSSRASLPIHFHFSCPTSSCSLLASLSLPLRCFLRVVLTRLALVIRWPQQGAVPKEGCVDPMMTIRRLSI